MNRSLAFKLTLAFLLVAAAAIGLFALFVRLSGPERLNQLLIEQNRAEFESALVTYYEQTGEWRGVEDYLRAGGFLPGLAPPPGAGNTPPAALPPAPNRRLEFGLAGPDGMVILPLDQNIRRGTRAPRDVLKMGEPIEVDGVVVGVILSHPDPVTLNPEEQAYLERTNQALLLAAGGALLLALAAGFLLAHSLTSPLRALTQAAHRMTAGDLEQQVHVVSHDEIGHLAQAFNRMSSQLAENNRLREQMTADIAHELRTPLTVIAGYVESMQDGVLPPSQERLSIIHSEVERLQLLVEDLRTLSRADAGKLNLNFQPLSPNGLLDQAAATYQHQAGKKHIFVNVDAWPNLPRIMADETRMIQVLGNLVSNALQHTPEGGKVTLQGRSEASRVMLSVSDTGPGISPEDLPHIFDRFYRADRSRNELDGGSGLGLAIAKAYVDAHQGRISVVSQVGEGTTMVIELPVSAVTDSEEN
ncbi:MAG: HAMP domain-containing histidine kinase [Anaerolineales bacterium]|nr:HAMP domain-containing histidine kinase [Anaerolineales bacterium]